MFPTPATGSLVADINVQGVTNLGAAGAALVSPIFGCNLSLLVGT